MGEDYRCDFNAIQPTKGYDPKNRWESSTFISSKYVFYKDVLCNISCYFYMMSTSTFHDFSHSSSYSCFFYSNQFVYYFPFIVIIRGLFTISTPLRFNPILWHKIYRCAQSKGTCALIHYHDHCEKTEIAWNIYERYP